MFKRNGIKASELTVEQPLKHRPRVVRVTLPDGRHHVFGDGGHFTSAENTVLGGGLVPSTTPRLADSYTEAERAELAEAERVYEAARSAVARLVEESWKAKRSRKRPSPGSGDGASTADDRDLARRLEEAREVEHETQVDLNRVRARIAAAARARLDPPAEEPQSLGERVAALEG